MKNKFFFLLGVSSSAFLSSSIIASQPLTLPYIEKSSSSTLNEEGCRLVNKIWHNISKGRIHALKKMMTPHFRTVGYAGDVSGSHATVKLLQELIGGHLQAATIPSVIALMKNDILVVYYTVGVTNPSISGTLWFQQESMFQKVHHKWMWTAQVDAVVQPVVP